MRPLSLLAIAGFTVSLSAQVVTTVAGVPGTAGSQDGPAHQATFNRPTWVDVDLTNGTIYVVDRANDALRKVTNGAVSTLALRQPSYYPAPGAPVPLDFGGPTGGGIAVEPRYAGCGGGPYAFGILLASSGRNQIVFAADLGNSGTLAERDDSSPILGSGAAGAVNSSQTLSSFNNPGDIALSWGYGGGGGTFSTDRLYIADTKNNIIRRVRYRLSFEACPQPYFIETEAGIAGEAGSNDGPAAGARFNAPRGVAAGPDGSIYVADTGNHTIRRIFGGAVTTVAGTAGEAGYDAAHLSSPTGIDVNGRGEVFFADSGNHVIRKLTTDGQLVTIAGTPGVAGYADGAALSARLFGPVGLRIVGEKLYIADTANNVVREYDPNAVPDRRRRAVGR